MDKTHRLLDKMRRRWRGNQLETLFPLWLGLVISACVLECFGLSEVGFVMMEIGALVMAGGALVIVIRHFRKDSESHLQFDLIYPILLLFLAVWTLRFDVELHTGIFDAGFAENDAVIQLNPLEHFFNSIVHALQSFSMDESYTDFVLAGKAYIRQMTWLSGFNPVHAVLYGGLCAAMNVTASIAGGAILLDVLANIFPEIRLRLQFLHQNNTRSYVFSELNERSIVLAESIRERSNRPNWEEKAFIVFTDVYRSDEEEVKAELIVRAKRINALCLKDDVSLLRRLSWGPISYFLMDDKDQGNVESLAALSDVSSALSNPIAESSHRETFIDGWKAMNSDVRIYVFSNLALIMRMIENFNKICRENGLENVMAKPIDVSENLAHQIMTEYPLYRAVEVDEKPEQREEVHLAMVGDSENIRQMIKTGYWCGQMLNPYSEELHRIIPHFHILCTDQNTFDHYMESEMPAVRQELATDNYGFPYARYSFECVEQLDRAAIQNFVDSIESIDYGMIDTGDDLQNIEICEWMKHSMAEKLLRGNERFELWCIVRNQDLNTIENSLRKSDQVVYLGNFREQYQIESIESNEQDREAVLVDNAYLMKVPNDIFSDLYSYRASKALALFYPYHMFSMGARRKGDGGVVTEPAAITGQGLDLLLNAGIGGTVREDSEKEMRRRIDRTIWLEKIRWNSYVKCEGMMAPSLQDVIVYYNRMIGDPKTAGKALELHKLEVFDDCKLKLHGCLMDLKTPRGIVIPYLTDSEYQALQQHMREAFDAERKAYEACDAAGRKAYRERRWYEFLSEQLKNSVEVWGVNPEHPLDELDIYSTLVKSGRGDYKDYDANLLITLMVRKLMAQSASEDRAELAQKLEKALEKREGTGRYLDHMFSDWLKAAKNYQKV